MDWLISLVLGIFAMFFGFMCFVLGFFVGSFQGVVRVYIDTITKLPVVQKIANGLDVEVGETDADAKIRKAFLAEIAKPNIAERVRRITPAKNTQFDDAIKTQKISKRQKKELEKVSKDINDLKTVWVPPHRRMLKNGKYKIIAGHHRIKWQDKRRK
jgi:hypothetical protein